MGLVIGKTRTVVGESASWGRTPHCEYCDEGRTAICKRGSGGENSDKGEIYDVLNEGFTC